MKKPTLEEAAIARFNETEFPRTVMDAERAIFDACYKAFAQRGWIFVFDRRVEPPIYSALPPETEASCLYRI